MPRGLRVVALVNEQAGVHERGLMELHRELAAAFEKHGIAAEIEQVEPGALVERAKRALAKAVASEIDAVMVGGGDGSIRCVAEVLAATGVPLAVLPLGTLNHFAKDLGAPLDVGGAVALIAQGETRKVDIGEVNGRVFLNTSSIGIYPYMVLDRERLRKTGLSKWFAMGMAALHALQHLPRRRLRIAVEGHLARVRTPLLFVGNNPYRLEPLSIGMRESLDRGLLWLCVAETKTASDLVWLAARALFGGLSPADDLQTSEVRSIQVCTRTSRLFVAIDGEVEIMQPPLEYRVRHEELLVFAPKSNGEPCV